jgi:hypothetical protein
LIIAWQWIVGLSIGLFFAMVVCLDVGFRIGMRGAKRSPELEHEGVGEIETAILGLLGLLLGFSFSGAISLLDEHRLQTVQEANAIGTAYLRVDVLPASDQPEMRRLFREYLDTRLRFYDSLSNRELSQQAATQVTELQHEIWTRAASASRDDPSQNVGRLLLPALNEMIDITTTRMIWLHTRLPRLIMILLSCTALLSGLFAGYSMSKRQTRSWLHMVLYAAVVAGTVYTVLDLESPRSGLIRLDAADQALKQLRNSIR